LDKNKMAEGKAQKDLVASGGGGKAQKDAGSDEDYSQQATAISKLFSKFMTQIDEKLDRLHASMVGDIKAIDSKVEAIALKENVGPAFPTKSHRGNRVSFGGGETILTSHDDFDLEDDSKRNSGRFSFSSSSSQNSKDIGTKLERPKFSIEKSFTKDGIKAELVQDSDYLNFLDDYDHYIDQWKTIPTNEGLPYPNENRVAIVSIPPKYARKMAARIHWIYDTKELSTFGSVKELKNAKYWSDLDSETLRLEIGKLVESELSTKGVLEAIRRVKWNSSFGIIDHLAFANFQHDFKRTVLRLQSGGVIKVEQVHLKDYLISALPDKQLQHELTAKYGQTGVIIGDLEKFAINNIFADIESYIQSISKLNLGRMVNKQNREREMAFSKGKLFQITADSEDLAELEEVQDVDDEQFQDRVNTLSSNYGAVKCRYSGIGSDGKLKCKWLANPEASCLFNHPESDLKMKGKGQSQDVTKTSSSHTRKVQQLTEIQSTDEDEL
jgi:hypothetical protein